MSAALPKSLHLFGVSVAYSSPSTTTKLASTSDPPSVSCTLPDAAVAGLLVRSPVSVLMGSPGTLPITDSTRCALLRFLVTPVDCLTNVVASGRGAPLCLEPDEHPAIRAVAMLRAVRTVNSRRRVCIPCIVEGADDRAGQRGARAPPANGVCTAQLGA